MFKEMVDSTADITFPIEGCDSWPVFLELFQKLFASFSNLFAEKKKNKKKKTNGLLLKL